ncbi:Hypothetical predicted protein [Pelobates cultripes]|nr:Hypothetical predicted protein [Pelobates cultripes]
MGMPNKARYYKAAMISTLINTFHYTNPPPWSQMETAQAAGLTIPMLAWLPNAYRPKHHKISPTTAATLQAWDELIGRSCLDMYISPALPLQAHKVLIPGFDYNLWNKHGVTYLS